MKAAVARNYGDLDEVMIEDVPVPKIDPTEVLVKVEAASVNPFDVQLISGKMNAFFPFTPPYTIGTDLSGIVVDVGALATRWKKGDRVFARLEPAPGAGNQYSRTGAFAEFVAVSAVHLAQVADNVAMSVGAAIPTAAGTAWQALFETAHLCADQKVLIHAGAGGVGSVAVQLAKSVGAFVIATASAANIEFVRSLGADVVIDYQTRDFADELTDLDVVLDTIGGDTQQRSFKVLRSGGYLVSIVSPPDKAEAQSHDITATFVFHKSDGARLDSIMSLVASGKLHIEVSHVFTLSEAQAALKQSATRRTRGKCIVNLT